MIRKAFMLLVNCEVSVARAALHPVQTVVPEDNRQLIGRLLRNQVRTSYIVTTNEQG